MFGIQVDPNQTSSTNETFRPNNLAQLLAQRVMQVNADVKSERRNVEGPSATTRLDGTIQESDGTIGDGRKTLIGAPFPAQMTSLRFKKPHDGQPKT
jgi:hypothetical protein